MCQEIVQQNPEILHFDSFFESGNLDCVIQISDNEYDLYMRVDSNSRGHTNWYYFRVSNFKKQQKIKFNICNFTKKKSLYQRGLLPYARIKDGEWKQSGQNCQYKTNIVSYQEQEKTYYKLTFEFTFEQETDYVEFASLPPYTYSMLQDYLNKLFQQQQNVNLNGMTLDNLDGGINQFTQYSSKYVKQSVLCKSISGLDVPLLEITDFEEISDLPYQERQVVVISARIHPSETCSTWISQGLIQFLMSSDAKMIRKHMIFYIIPILNPDGVLIGNQRTNFSGKDLNRQFYSHKKFIYPTVQGLKKLIYDLKLKFENNLVCFLDLHGHSLRKNIFVYGPRFPIDDLRYYTIKMLAKLISKKSQLFRFYSCKFKNEKYKSHTARVFIQDNFAIDICYTIETSMGMYMDDQKQMKRFGVQDWIDFGETLATSVFGHFKNMDLFYQIKEHKQSNIDKNSKQRNKKFMANKKISLNKKNLHNLTEIIQELVLDEQDAPNKLNESDDFSELHYDSESSNEDLDEAQLKKFHKQIETLNSNSSIPDINQKIVIQKPKKQVKNKKDHHKKAKSIFIQSQDPPEPLTNPSPNSPPKFPLKNLKFSNYHKPQLNLPKFHKPAIVQGVNPETDRVHKQNFQDSSYFAKNALKQRYLTLQDVSQQVFLLPSRTEQSPQIMSNRNHYQQKVEKQLPKVSSNSPLPIDKRFIEIPRPAILTKKPTAKRFQWNNDQNLQLNFSRKINEIQQFIVEYKQSQSEVVQNSKVGKQVRDYSFYLKNLGQDIGQSNNQQRRGRGQNMSFSEGGKDTIQVLNINQSIEVQDKRRILPNIFN